MSNASNLLYAVAKAMNGPHYADQCADGLDAERDRRWLDLSVQDKRALLQKARVAIAQYVSGGARAVALTRPLS